MFHKYLPLILVIIILSGGCARAPYAKAGATPHSHKKVEQKRESKKEIKDAIEKISDSVGQRSVSAKYCPACGRHYSADLKICPLDETSLKEVQE